MTEHIFGYGEYFYFRCHEWEGGWGVSRERDGEIVALVFDKNMAGIIADALNRIACLYKIHDQLELLPILHKIECGSIFEINDLKLTRQQRVERYLKERKDKE